MARGLRQWQQGVEGVEVALHFGKMRDYIKKLLQKNKELGEGAPKQIIVASPKGKSHTYMQKAAELLAAPTQAPLSMHPTRHSSISADLPESPADRRQKALFERLYSEASRKRDDSLKLQAERDARMMEECTFTPEVRSFSPTRDSVFER